MSDSIINISVNTQQITEALDKAPQKVISGIKGWVKRTAANTERVGKREVPVRHGALQSSISIETDASGLRATVKPHKDYAQKVIEGTGLYGPLKRRIYPRHAKVLASRVNPGFGTKNSKGYYIIGRFSNGQKPNEFMDRTFDEVKQPAEADADATLSQIVGSL